MESLIRNMLRVFASRSRNVGDLVVREHLQISGEKHRVIRLDLSAAWRAASPGSTTANTDKRGFKIAEFSFEFRVPGT